VAKRWNVEQLGQSGNACGRVQLVSLYPELTTSLRKSASTSAILAACVNAN
jgi:hypothetical protein